MEDRRRCAVASGHRALAVAAVCVLLVAAGASAAPYTIQLYYQAEVGVGTASGSVTFDSSLLTTGKTGGVCDTTEIISFTLTFKGLPVSPFTTTFTKVDLTDWLLNLSGPGGNITDLNFFMAECGGSSNADGWVINGSSENTLRLYAPTGAPLADFQRLAAPIPALSGWGLAALAALLAAAGAVALRRLA